MIKSIIFDCSDTLLRFEAKADLAEKLKDPEQAEHIHQSIFKSEAWKKYDRGWISAEQLEEEVLPTLPTEDRPIATDYLQSWHTCYSPMPGMTELVQRLKGKGYGLYVLSSYPDRFYQVWERFPIFRLFDGAAASFEAHVSKDSPAFFEYLMKKYHLKAEECLIIDDAGLSVETARSIGWTGIQFTDAETLEKELKGLNIL